MHYVNRKDNQHKEINTTENPKYSKPRFDLSKLSTAQLRYWIHSYEKGIKNLKEGT